MEVGLEAVENGTPGMEQCVFILFLFSLKRVGKVLLSTSIRLIDLGGK